MRRLWHILSGNSLISERNLESIKLSTIALIQFCEDHDAADKTHELKNILAAIERDDRLAATRAFKSVHFGGMGSFADWIPPVKFANETEDYVQQVFIALTVQWYEFASEILLPRKR